MSHLGDLLVLLHDARGRVSTLRATVRGWHDVRAAREAMQRFAGEGAVTAYAQAAGPEAREVADSVARLWFAPGGLVREEREERGQKWFGVRRGDLWWHYDEQHGAMSNETEPDTGSGIGQEFRWLLDAAPVMGLLEFGPITEGSCAGRTTWHARAVPRRLADGEDWPLIRMGVAGADELWLDVDAERGTLLRVESRFEQQTIAIAEVVEIDFDDTFPREVFEFTPPPGEVVRPLTDRYRIEHDLTIEQAAARAPFTVWIPSRVPSGWQLGVTFVAEAERPPAAPHVHLRYEAPDGTHSFQISQSPADHPGEHVDYEQARANPWQTVERNGRTIETRAPAEGWQSALARLQLDETRILIESENLSADSLTDVAAGLTHAPSSPPDLAR